MDRILVGLDGSPGAVKVLERAIELARRSGGKLLLFRAVGVPIDIPQAAYSMSPDALSGLLQDEAKRHLEQVAATVPKELLLGVAIGVGTAWQGICAAADENAIDLIVIGSHGYRGIDLLIGTTAAKVVNHSHQSVMVVRSHDAKP